MTRSHIFCFATICFTLALYASAAHAYTPQSPPPPTKNVYEIIAANKKLSKFTGMIDRAGLKDMLSANTGEPITVFAPSNDALNDIPGDVMKRIEASTASQQSFIKYHIIAGSMVSSGAIKGRRASPAAANGEALSFDGSDHTKPPKVGDGTLEQADIVATNGIIHIVSGALVPPSLAAAPAPPPPPQPAKPAAPAPVAAAPAAAEAPATAAPATTTAAASPAPPAPVHVTTSGVAKAPAAATTTALPATSTSSGFELFGHKFGW